MGSVFNSCVPSHVEDWRRPSRRSDSVSKLEDNGWKKGLKTDMRICRSTAILSALQTAIDTRSANLMTIALDCLGKFITYNYLADIEDEATQSQVMERVVDSICDCFIGEDTDEKVQLQIIKV